ncbi:efflux RND transporter permease subunit [Endozoicomonas sp.]|uniref:efflux RND transporter permease subunit n=1 Tax=Endozoicomonas sp. TaxID=1892382 RepID=UPI002887477F|nr:efflux RND transporter permease subunit [Endozoicomonas sp.]
MKLPAIAIQNYRFTLIIILLMVISGIVSINTMPRSEDPQYEIPAAMVRVLYPGTSPLDMERLIVDPIEEAINELADIRVLKANIEDGLAVIQVEFLYGSDSQIKFAEVVSEITRIRDRLPDDIAILTIDRVSPSDVNVLQVALVADDHSYLTLKKLSEKLEKRFARVPGVKRATVEALPEQQLHIEANLARMKALGIGLEDLVQAIQRSGINRPGGHILGGERRFTVITSGEFSTVEQIKKTPVHATPGNIIYIEDIASIKLTNALPTYEARYNDKKAVFISVVQREGSNIFQMMDGLQAELNQFQEQLPKGINIERAHDQSESVDERTSLFFDSLFQGLVLVGLMTLALLGVRSAVVIILAIPASILISLAWLDLLGFGLQQMSIAGLVIALGLLVDNAIVVTENISRFLRQGFNPWEAAAKGTSQVGWAITSGTLTTVIAFIPVLFLQSGSGIFLRSMPVTVILTLIASLLIALTLTPLLASLLLKGGTALQPEDAKTPFLQQLIQRFASSTYRPLLTHGLKHPWQVLIIAVVMVAGSIMLARQLGVSLFPKAEKPIILVNIELPEGASFDQTKAMAIDVEKTIKPHPMVRSITTNIGRDNPRVYYNILPKRQVPNYAQLVVKLKSGRLSEVEPFVDDLRSAFVNMAGARIIVKELLQGPPCEAPISIRVIGDDLNKVLTASRAVEQIMINTPGTVNVDNPIDKSRVNLHIDINREKAAMAGVSIPSINEVIRASLVGVAVSILRDDSGKDYPIIVRYQGEYPNSEHRPRIEDFNHIMVKSTTGHLIPVKQLVALQMKSALPRFQHHMTERMTRVTADIQAGYQTEPVTNAIVVFLDQYPWPEGISYQVGGEQEQRKVSFAGMSKVLLIAIVGIFAILVLQFNSFSQPAVVFAAIPFAVTGMILALWLAGYTFSFTAFIGLTALVGIVVNNSIILVDYTNLLLKEGRTLKEAILESAQTRLLPILLTTVTTIGGLLPLTLSNSALWTPMGLTIIGGLLISTLLTLIVVPVLYFLFSRQPV